MTKFGKSAHTTKWISVKDLSVIWAAAQREFDPRHAATIAANFDPDMFGVLAVTLPNGDGIYHVIDGQHRKNAVQQLYGDGEQVPCYIFDAEEPARAAEIFDKINTGRKAPRPMERFKVRVTARYQTEVAVNKIVEAAGYKIGRGTDGTIQAVDALVSIFKRFGSLALADTLSVILQTFGNDRHAVDAAIIRGYGAFIAEFRPHLDKKRLVQVIQKQYSPGRLLGAAKTAKEMNRSGLAEAVKYVLLQNYNHKLRNGTLKEKEKRHSAAKSPTNDTKH